ncbi:MAG TPA: ATP-binding cassette domain-containing protein [Acidimicrobiales bacterium]|jgi:putative ABC transport system ATP-binding protein|nr:ATP-binding cassette domain-containing protein [Acidimicrobiales bacterium]
MSAPELVIELDGVSVTHPGLPPVEGLAPISLRVPRGAYTALLGPAGSGKSTLLNLLALIDAPVSGEYWMCGRATARLSEVQRAHLRTTLIGLVTDEAGLVPHLSVVENVELSMLYEDIPAGERRNRAIVALVAVGLGGQLRAYAARLSAAERRCAAIARAVAPRPVVLLCDEPTGGVPDEGAPAVLGALDRLHAAGHTVVVATRHPAVADRAETVVELARRSSLP